MPISTRVWSAGKFLVLGVALLATYVVFAAASMRIAVRSREVQVPAVIRLSCRAVNEDCKIGDTVVTQNAAVSFRLEEVLDRAAEGAGLARTGWLRQPRGDGELAVLPADSDVSRVLADFVHEVVEELRRGSRPRLRLRISMHHGALTAGVFGPR